MRWITSMYGEKCRGDMKKINPLTMKKTYLDGALVLLIELV